MKNFRTLFLLSLTLLLFTTSCSKENNTSTQGSVLQFVYTSDAHYGITRKKFQGNTNVNATAVNQVLINKLNLLPTFSIPKDGGVNAGNVVGAVEFVANTGDFCNRYESNVGSVASSWESFLAQYINGITLKKRDGSRAEVLYTIGNHDVSNAIGYTKPITKDPLAFINTYNNMVKPSVPITAETFDYTQHKVHFSKEIDGIQFLFINMWPDGVERAWINGALNGKPAILFTHDEPAIEAKHLLSPNGRDDFANKFENLVEITGTTASASTDEHQADLAQWLKQTPAVKAYFHGNTNYNEFYNFTVSGLSLPVFRVDSPMKGDESSNDETRLSFQLVSIDTKSGKMTVREVLYNSKASADDKSIEWGESKTVQIF